MSDLIPAPPRSLTRADDSPLQARLDLEAARARVRRSLDQLETTLPVLTSWRETVRRHPAITAGAAFLAGYLLARLFTRKD